MREIKVRGYSKVKNRIYEVVKINWISYAVWFKGTDFVGNLGKHDTILLQYTGYKDRDGKEIYEGDILKYVYSPFHRDFEQRKYRLVEYIDYLGVKPIAAYSPLYAYPSTEFIVEGNKYKNPELLKENI